MDLHNEYLQKRAQTLRLGLDQRLSELYSSYYPNSNPKTLIDSLRQFLLFVDDRIHSSSNDKLEWIIQVLEELEYFLVDLHYANSEEIPRGLVQILEDLVGQIFTGVDLMASPQREDFNYSIEQLLPYLHDFTRGLLSSQESDSVFKSFKDRFDVIRFPRIERDNVLSYPIFGHELGHHIADDFLEEEEETTLYKERLEKAAKEAKELLEPSEEGEYSIQQSKNIIDEMLNIRKRGLEELISDCVGVLLFGPSALFAFHDVFLGAFLDEDPKEPYYYPPPRYRMRIMNDVMEREGYKDALIGAAEEADIEKLKTNVKQYLSYMDGLIGNSQDRDILISVPLLKISYEWIEECLPAAVEYARETVKKIIYSSDAMRAELPKLIERIAVGVTPNEIGAYPNIKIADWRSAILAGWMYRVGDISIPSSKGGPLERDSIDRLQRLTLRSVELIIIKNQYTSACASGSGE